MASRQRRRQLLQLRQQHELHAPDWTARQMAEQAQTQAGMPLGTETRTAVGKMVALEEAARTARTVRTALELAAGIAARTALELAGTAARTVRTALVGTAARTVRTALVGTASRTALALTLVGTASRTALALVDTGRAVGGTGKHTAEEEEPEQGRARAGDMVSVSGPPRTGMTPSQREVHLAQDLQTTGFEPCHHFPRTAWCFGKDLRRCAGPQGETRSGPRMVE